MELGAFFTLLVTAGINTASNAMAHGLKLLTAHPEQRELLVNDFDKHIGTCIDHHAVVHVGRLLAVVEEQQFTGGVVGLGVRRYALAVGKAPPQSCLPRVSPVYGSTRYRSPHW